MREDRSILDLIDADYTFLNDTLARHYGITPTERLVPNSSVCLWAIESEVDC